MNYTITPVGFVRSPVKEKLGKDTDRKELVSELVIENEDLLEGIEDFSHLLVIYWPHQIEEQRRTITKVHPMGRKDLPEKGIFATMSPARPNPLLVTVVELVERKNNILRVRGLEAFDQSPVMDIKPYTEYYYAAEGEINEGWIKMLSSKTNKSF